MGVGAGDPAVCGELVGGFLRVECVGLQTRLDPLLGEWAV
jgi:hypothetical protein